MHNWEFSGRTGGNDAAKAPWEKQEEQQQNSVTFSEGGRLGTEDLAEDKRKGWQSEDSAVHAVYHVAFSHTWLESREVGLP